MTKRTKKIGMMLICDLVLLGACLLVFAYFHHVRIDRIEPQPIAQTETVEPLPEQSPETIDGADTQNAEISAQETPAAENLPEDGETGTSEPPAGLLQGKYAEKFTPDVQIGEGTYSSPDVAVTVETIERFGSKVHVADVYIKNLEALRTAVFDSFSRYYMSTEEMANKAGAIVAISGDHFYAHRAAGVFAIRNRMQYAANPNAKQDICVLYDNGEMEVVPAEQIDVDAILARNPYQVWDFGPGMLDANGKGLEKYRSSVANTNPRSAIGYFEPGHYCLINVEGRTKDSGGLTLVEFGKVFEELGCTVAYNLDGGKTAVMTFNGSVWSHVLGGGREVSDIVYICDPANMTEATEE